MYNSVIGEIGVRNFEGKPYPSAGFTSAIVMAHEIGHNLGEKNSSTLKNSSMVNDFDR